MIKNITVIGGGSTGHMVAAVMSLRGTEAFAKELDAVKALGGIQLRGAVRGALCDHNARAQELCDSIGFSLCDCRLPLPE